MGPLAFTVLAIVVWKITDFIRTITTNDLKWNVPTEWWALVAWAIGTGTAFVVCNVSAFSAFVGAQQGGGCADAILKGLGFAGVSAFVHAVTAALPSPGGVKGLTPSPKVPATPPPTA
jgi:hypothetical protein